MALQKTDIQADVETNTPLRRKHVRIYCRHTAEWDFFSAGGGTKRGYIENLSEGGCLLRTSDAIEHRRWIRVIVRDDFRGLYFTLVGRTVRREDKMESWNDEAVTLYRYGLEFVQPINPLILGQLQDREELGNLRQACHNLLVHESAEGA